MFNEGPLLTRLTVSGTPIRDRCGHSTPDPGECMIMYLENWCFSGEARNPTRAAELPEASMDDFWDRPAYWRRVEMKRATFDLGALCGAFAASK